MLESNRRYWLKQIGLSVAGIGLSNLNAISAPTNTVEKISADNLPIRLSSNENPYGPSPLARAAMIENINISNRYNWQLSTDLIQAIAKNNVISTDNILLGAGSTEILDLVTRLSASKKGSFLIADPSYSYWTEAAEKLGLKKSCD